LKALLQESKNATTISGSDLLSRISNPSTSSQSNFTARRDNNKKKSKKRRRAYDSDSDSESDTGNNSNCESQGDSFSDVKTPTAPHLHSRSKRPKARSSDSASSSSSERTDSPTSPPSSSYSRGQARSSMTLGELLHPPSSRLNSALDCAGTSVASSYFAQARRTTPSSSNVDTQTTRGGKVGNIPSGAGKGGKVDDGDDIWMEDSAFDDVCVTSPDLSPGTKPKRGRPTGRSETRPYIPENSSVDVKERSESKHGPLVSTRRKREKVMGRKKGAVKVDAADDVNEDEDEEAHRPSFPGKAFTTALAEPLILTYKDKKSESTAANNIVDSTAGINGTGSVVKGGAEGNNQDREIEKEQVTDTTKAVVKTTRVPVYTMRYLKDYQVEGVRWLWNKYAKGLGCILGDDMGLGKTVQIAAFLMALYEKSGKKAIDAPLNRERSRNGYNLNLEESASSNPNSSLECNIGVTGANVSTERENVSLCPPCLVIAPASLITNWQEELDRWGYFLLSTLDSKQDSLEAINAARLGRVEVVLGSYNKMEMYSSELGAVSWSVVIWDEGHMLKNDNTKGYKAACRINKVRSRIILSGTPIQNKHEEFWCLLNLVSMALNLLVYDQ